MVKVFLTIIHPLFNIEDLDLDMSKQFLIMKIELYLQALQS